MKKNNRSYLLLAAAISLTSVPLGSSLTRAAFLPTTILNQGSNINIKLQSNIVDRGDKGDKGEEVLSTNATSYKPLTWTTQPHMPGASQFCKNTQEWEHLAPLCYSSVQDARTTNLQKRDAPRTPELIARANRSYSNQLLFLINSERRKVGALPLRINSNLTQAALSQSQDMATRNFFSHTGSNGSQLSVRVSATGYNWSAVAENIAAGQSTPSQVFQSWLNSPSHKQNMLNPTYRDVGFGYASNTLSTYKTYWTATFAKPR